MSNDFMLVSGLDQKTPLKNAEKMIFDKIDDVIKQAVADEDMSPIWNAGMGMGVTGKVIGIGLAKLFFDGFQVWRRLELGDEDAYYSETFTNAGYSKATVKRGVEIWSMFENDVIPGQYREEIMELGVKALRPISQLVKEDVKIESNDWLAFTRCIDEAEVRQKCRELSGKEENANNKTRYIDDDGDYTMWVGGKQYFIGHFNMTEKDPVVMAEISRAINLLGLMEKQ